MEAPENSEAREYSKPECSGAGHGVPADKGKAMFLGNALQRIADYLLDAAAVDHQRAFFYLMGVLGDVFHRGLQDKGQQ